MFSAWLTPTDIGKCSALCASLAWAIASSLFWGAGKQVPPALLNTYKGALAIGMILMTMVIFPQLFEPLPAIAWGILLLSGIIGIGIGETAYFACLNRLGNRRALLILESGAPIGAFLFAQVLLNDKLSLATLGGVVLTLCGVSWVILERRDRTAKRDGKVTSGTVFGIIAAACQATGVVLSRYAMVEFGISPFGSTLVRLIGGTAAAGAWLLVSRPKSLKELSALRSLWRTVALAAFLGTFSGVFLQQVALERVAAGIAQTLFAVSVLWSLLFVYLRGGRISLRSVLGSSLAFVGIAAVFVFD